MKSQAEILQEHLEQSTTDATTTNTDMEWASQYSGNNEVPKELGRKSQASRKSEQIKPVKDDNSEFSADNFRFDNDDDSNNRVTGATANQSSSMFVKNPSQRKESQFDNKRVKHHTSYKEQS